MADTPKFTIVTPSFRNSEWLRLCIASVADQGVPLEHLVQDACSDDGTQDWLPHDRRVQAIVEKDKGMYDAVNRGLRRARGDILSYLNCDEQYLPGALDQVGRFFDAHPEAEVAFADAIVVHADGKYLCDRRASVPTKYHSWVGGSLAILTAATFFRRSLIDRHALFFDDRYRDLGDVMWVMSLIERRIRMAVLPAFTSTFTETGDNMNLKPNAQREKAEVLAKAPAWARQARRLILLRYRLRRLWAGHYGRKPAYDYEIYTRASPAARARFHVPNPSFRYHRVPVQAP